MLSQWILTIEGDSGKAQFVPNIDQQPLRPDDNSTLVQRNGGFEVDLTTGCVDIAYWSPEEYIIPKDYKSIILTNLPKIVTPSQTSLLMPKLHLAKRLQPSFVNPNGYALAHVNDRLQRQAQQ